MRKPESAEIHGENRHLVRAHCARGGEKRAVTTENDQPIDLAAHFFAAQPGGREASACLRVRIEIGLHVARGEPLDQRRHDRRDHFLDRFADNSSGADHQCWKKILLYAATRVQEKLLVALGPGDVARLHSDDGETKVAGGGDDPFDGCFV